MQLSPEAIQHDSEWEHRVPVKEIYMDQDFNCRGFIPTQDIVELVKDVAAKGLLQPVVVRELWDTEGKIKDQGYKYSLVSGFRRLSCYKVLNAERVPVHIRKITSEFEARDINAVENLQRKDLTLLQEAVSIRHYWLANWSRQDIAKRVNKSDGWVQIRVMLLQMEPEIQQAAHQGYISSSDIRLLYSFNGAERLKRAGAIRDARKRGEKGITVRFKKLDKASTKRVRTKSEIQEMMDYIREYAKKVDKDQQISVSNIVSDQGTITPLHRVCAWASGDVTTLDLHTSLKAFFDFLGVHYETPELEPEHVL